MVVKLQAGLAAPTTRSRLAAPATKDIDAFVAGGAGNLQVVGTVWGTGWWRFSRRNGLRELKTPADPVFLARLGAVQA